MSIWSDNAGPDYLRARLGDQALIDTARDVGWTDPELISTTGFLVLLYTPELVPPASDRPARRAAEWDLARRYATDPAFRAKQATRPVARPKPRHTLQSSHDHHRTPRLVTADPR